MSPNFHVPYLASFQQGGRFDHLQTKIPITAKTYLMLKPVVGHARNFLYPINTHALEEGDVKEVETINIQQLKLLRVMLQIRQWEAVHQTVLRTHSGRDLYLRLATSLLEDEGKPKALKYLQGQMTERSTRERIKEFQAQGLIDFVSHESDQRTKFAMPTKKFVAELNEHLNCIKHICEQEFLMIDKQ
jgi:hypothetical protein